MVKFLKFLVLPVLLFLSCASIKYEYYGVAPFEGESLKGTLLAKKEKDDLPLSKCDPTSEQKGKCVVLFVEEFERLMTDFHTMEEKLKDCAVQRP